MTAAAVSSSSSRVPPPADRLRALFREADPSTLPYTMPTCWDGLSARLLARSTKYKIAFLSGYCVAASHGYPDLGILSVDEMTTAVRHCVETLAEVAVEQGGTAIPLIADGDTGYGPPHILKRTVKAYARAQAACIMIEDQVGHQILVIIKY